MKLYIGIIMVTLLLIACGSNAVGPEPTTVPPAQPVAQPVQPSNVPPISTPPPVTVVKPTTPQPTTLSADGQKLKEFITVADSKLKSYKYFFSDKRPDPNVRFPLAGDFSVRGTKMRIDIRNQPPELSARQANYGNSDASVYQPMIYGDDYYDYFFLDLAAQKAYAGCQNSLCRHKGTITPVAFADYIRKTPMDWRNEIPLDSVKIVDSKQIQGQSIIRVTYEKDGVPVMQWLEKYAMLPIQVDLGEGDDAEHIYFVNFAPNAVSDAVFAEMPK